MPFGRHRIAKPKLVAIEVTRWPTAKARLGHRVNANTHKPIRFTSGTNARIVHHRLRPPHSCCCGLKNGELPNRDLRIGLGLTELHTNVALARASARAVSESMRAPILSLGATSSSIACMTRAHQPSRLH
jgi:hypothetical protein